MSIRGTMLLAVVSFVAIIIVAFVFFQFAAARHEEDIELSKALGNLKHLIARTVRILDEYTVTRDEARKEDFKKAMEGISENLAILEKAFKGEADRVRDLINGARAISDEVFSGEKVDEKQLMEMGRKAERKVLEEIDRIYEKLNGRIKGEMKLGYVVNFAGLILASSLLAMGMWMLAKIARGFDNVLSATRDFAKMDFTGKVERSGVKELDEMLNTMDFLAEGWSRFVSRFLAMVKILDGTLRKMIGKVEDFVDDTNKLKESIDGFVSSSLEVAEGMERLTSEVMDMVSQVEEEIADIEAGTEREKENIDRIKRTLDRVGEMMVKVGEMGKKMDEVQGYVEDMVGMSREIENFIETVTSIADQTNLLALNAAIEAARAGEVGKGFAVVADEVRKLADESKRAAEEISGVMKSIVGNISNASEGFDVLKEEFEKIKAEFEDIKGAFMESGERLEGMADNLTQITERLSGFLDMLKQSSEDVLRASENSKKVAEEAKFSSGVLEDMINTLKAMEKFTLVRDMFNELAQQVGAIKIRDIELDPERVEGAKEEIRSIFGGMEEVLGMTGFFSDTQGKPLRDVKVVNPVCAKVDRRICDISRRRLIESSEGREVVYGYCDAGMLHAFIPLRKDGKLMGGIMMCGALPEDWRDRLSVYSEHTGIPEEELDKVFRTRLSFSEGDVEELARTIVSFLKGL